MAIQPISQYFALGWRSRAYIQAKIATRMVMTTTTRMRLKGATNHTSQVRTSERRVNTPIPLEMYYRQLRGGSLVTLGYHLKDSRAPEVPPVLCGECLRTRNYGCKPFGEFTIDLLEPLPKEI